ncbi:MAG: hypothetical protein QNK30_07040 [Bacteroidales bacterium]|nr:hypothetical protein [Bacteroidales bacterium]
MASFFYIQTIAKFEAKTLIRSWFFRIFAALSLVVLFFFNLVMQTEIEREWDFLAIPSGIPYGNIFMLNIAQAIIAVFLASEFLQRDKKLDTTDVIYIRPMTNGEYVLGKTLGNLFVFLGMNILILLMVLIFNVISPVSGVDLPAYAYYVGLISIPTLIFILGLSFLTMSLVRNQAVTFVLLLGYIATTLFYLQDKVNYIFDYMAFSLPLMKSDFVGFSNINEILIHRGIYLFLGLGFIFITILMLKRLPQSRWFTSLSIFLSIVFISMGSYLAYIHLNRFNLNEKARENYLAVNDELVGQPIVNILRHHIELKHSDEAITAISKICVQNNNNEALSELVFTLNPNLLIQNISHSGKTIQFQRNLHIIKVFPDPVLSPSDTISLTIEYEGGIDESFCYLDIDKKTLSRRNSVALFNINKKYGFIDKNFVLLIPEASWYPTSGPTYSSKNPVGPNQQFINFSLDVTTYDSLIPISQGAYEKTGSKYQFRPEYPLLGISVIIGDYQRKEATIDSTSFGIVYKTGHDFFSDALTELNDTVINIVSDRFSDYKRNINLQYPFQRFSLVEVPIQFYTYSHIWKGGFEQVQPEIVFFPEKGMPIRESDLVGSVKRSKRRSRWSNEKLTDKEYEVRAINNFCAVFTKDQGNPDWSRSERGEFQPLETPNPYNIYSNFYGYTNYLDSKAWPIINRILESYLQATSYNQENSWMRRYSGISENERANIALQSHSFEQLLEDQEQNQIIDNIIKLKGDVLFSIIRSKAGKKEFDDFLYSMVEENRYRKIQFSDFNTSLIDNFGIDLSESMEKWFNSIDLPGYLFSQPTATKVKLGEMIKTKVQFKVTNAENTDGIIKIIFRLSDRGGRAQDNGSFQDDNIVNKVLFLEANQTKEVSYLLDDDPRSMTLNTLTSKNIPVEIERSFSKIEENYKAIAIEQEVIVSDPVSLLQENEIIIDNEDPLFSVQEPSAQGLLIKLLQSDDLEGDKYSGFRGWRPPFNWISTTNSSFYGKYIRSSSYVKSGTGDRIAIWKAPLIGSEIYDVYYYIDYQQQNDYKNTGDPGQYQFIIHHDDGTDDPSLSIKDSEPGWNHLGSYYFSGDTAVVELSNKTKGRLVIADAIKLVKQ